MKNLLAYLSQNNHKNIFASLYALSFIILLLNLILKSIFISSIPPILTHDEIYYATEALSILTNLSDVTGTWHPWYLIPANPIYTELTGLTYAPGFVLFPGNTQAAMKVMPIIFGSLLPIILGSISYALFKKKVFFLTTAILATVNPWIFQFSRMSFDSLASVFFYSCGIVAMLYLKGWKILWALIPFTLGFYQYQGNKPILVPLVFITFMFAILSDKKIELSTIKINIWKYIKNIAPSLSLLLLMIILVITYAIRLPETAAGIRVAEFVVDQNTVAQQVNYSRRLTFNNPLNPIFENKFSYTGQQMIYKFVNTFDLTWLFQHGNDSIDTFSVTEFGFLYAIDIVLILFAIVIFFGTRTWRLQACYLIGIVIIGTIPSVLKNESLWLTFRGSFIVLGLLLLASGGLALLITQKKKIPLILITLIYSISVIFFFYHYFFQYPLRTTKDTFFYNRVVANYIKRQPEKTFLIYGDKNLFDAVITYNHLINQDTIEQINHSYSTYDFEVRNIKFESNCINRQWIATQSAMVIIVDKSFPDCPDDNTQQATISASLTDPITVSSVIDSGGKFDIYYDGLCGSYKLKPFIDINNNVLAVEKLSNQSFCENLITKKQRVTNKYDKSPSSLELVHLYH